MSKKKEIVLSTAFETYIVKRQINVGGCGIIYEVSDNSNNTFAAKVLDPSRASKDKRKRFKNELYFCLNNNHSNIIRILDWGACESNGKDTMFYVMPLFPTTLRTLISNSIEHDQILSIFFGILDGVECAHLKGVIHRDLKPENILWDSNKKKPIVADFGIAHFAEEDLFTAVETKHTDRLANFQYSAPEQRQRNKIVDKPADIFALGLILNEMFTNEIPQGTDYKIIADINENFAYLDNIIDTMIKQNSSDRYQTIDDLKQEIQLLGKKIVSRQKLDDLNKIVVQSGEITDHYITDPVTVIDIDYKNKKLIFTLSKPVTGIWIEAFREIGGWISSAPPNAFDFQRDIATIRIDYASQATEIVKWFKSNYLPNATEVYKKRREGEQAVLERREKEELQRKIKEEETRRQILNDISNL